MDALPLDALPLDALPLDALPLDLLRLVFSYVPWRDRMRCRAVCRRWLGALRDAAAWRVVLRDRLRSLLGEYCRRGDADAVRRVISHFGLTMDDALHSGALRVACVYGHEQIARWYMGRWPVAQWLARWPARVPDLQPRAADIVCGQYSIFSAVCECGHLGVARWLTKTFDISAQDVRRSNTALGEACGRGHLAVAKWLAATFGLTAADVRVSDNYALRRACQNGHLDVAKWLAATFGLTAADARAQANYALRRACQNGHLDVAVWLTATFGLTAADARAGNNCALQLACEYGYLEVVKWLVATFGLTTDDARSDNNYALRLACRAVNFNVVRWLVSTFDFGVEDARSCRDEIGTVEYAEFFDDIFTEAGIVLEAAAESATASD